MDEHFAISPRYTTHDFPDIGSASVDDQIAVFEDRILGWQLNIADALKNVPHSGFGVLAIAMSYFESIEKCRDGVTSRNESKQYFARGARRVLEPHLAPGMTVRDDVIDCLWSEVRNGMYHDSIAAPRIMLSEMPPPVVLRLVVNPESGNLMGLCIDPHRLVSVLRADFASYVGELRNPENGELRENFRRRFRGRKGLS